jgi:hypothetical protein
MAFEISYTVDSSLVTKRVHGQIMREVNRGMLLRWRDRYLPLHFQSGNHQRYRLDIRSIRHTIRKRRKYGHSIPLVFSGQLRDTIRQNMKPPTATQYRASIRSRGYFRMKEGLRSEIERVMPFENEELAEWALKEYTRMARSPQYRRIRRRKGSGGTATGTGTIG